MEKTPPPRKRSGKRRPVLMVLGLGDIVVGINTY